MTATRAMTYGIAAQNDPYFSSVIFLSHFDGTNGSQSFVDSSSLAHTFGTPGATVVLTNSAPLFGPTCLSATAVGNLLNVNGNNNLNLGSGDWTIEFAFKTASPSTTAAIFDMRTSATQVSPDIRISSSNFRFLVSNADVITGGTVATSTWQRFALSKNSGTTNMYVDGTQVGSSYTDGNNYNISTPPIWFGGSFNASNSVACFFDEVRVTKGVGRYPSNYTVATGPFPNF